jgi:hypothetical protein
VVLPTLDDDHPDHSALRIMVDLALLGSGSQAVRYGYAVHGKDGDGRRFAAPGGAEFRQRKLRALAAYRSQTALSEGRLFAMSARPESFVAAGEPSLPPAGSLEFDIACSGGLPLVSAHELLVVAASRVGTRRFRVRLPRLLRPGLVAGDGTGALRLRLVQGGIRVSLSAPTAPLQGLWAKLHRCDPRLVVFDRRRWQDAATLFGEQPAQASAEPAPGWR